MCDDRSSDAGRDLAEWYQAIAAQADGDHATAEQIFARIARADSTDAEARFQEAIEAGWSASVITPGHHRFDEVLVGVATALERAASSEVREELRQRAARALTVLGEMQFARSQDQLLDVRGASLNEALIHHVVLGAAVLRLLDSAVELAPHDSIASEAIIRVADDLASRVGGPRGLRIAGLGFRETIPIEGAAVGRARERAVRHLEALARTPRLDRHPSDRVTLSSDDRITIPQPIGR